MSLNTEPMSESRGLEKTEGFVEVFGSKIHYESRGFGDPLLLIDGWLGSIHAFDRTISNLSKTHRCTAIDYPGYGVSSEFTVKRHTINNYAEAFFGVMDELAIARTGIIGDSLGALVALKMAEMNPDRINFLVLQGVPTFPPRVKKIARSLDRNIVGKLATDIFNSPVAEVIRWANPEFTGLSFNERDAAKERLKKTSGHAAIESFKDMVEFDLTQAASKVSVPALIVEGELAAKTPFAAGSILRKNIEEGLFTEKVVGKGTHTVMLKQPEVFAQAVNEFTQRLEGAVG